ncbi:MAG: hypothetical protein OEY44_01490 [Candidatus Peregrinibacteria bacterium]|nr:hypothetical protein [Candidatus Peregrinibacteria bacterium]
MSPAEQLQTDDPFGEFDDFGLPSPRTQPPAKSTVEELADHLRDNANSPAIQEMIKLLEDIRHHQGHATIQDAHDQNRHQVATHAMDHSKDFYEILAQDYINEMGGMLEGTESHKEGVHIHVEHSLPGALKDYHEAVQGIRDEVEEVANHLREDASINNVAHFVESVKGYKDEENVAASMGELGPHHEAHHVFHGSSDDVHHALATVAVRKGYRNGEAAAHYVKGELFEKMRGHFDDALSLAQAPVKESGVYMREIPSKDALIEQLRTADLGSPEGNLLKLLKAGYEAHNRDAWITRKLNEKPELLEMISELRGANGDGADGIAEAFLAQRKSEGDQALNFGEYVDGLLVKFQEQCDHGVYQSLLNWGTRQTIPAPVAPPSVRGDYLSAPMPEELLGKQPGADKEGEGSFAPLPSDPVTFMELRQRKRPETSEPSAPILPPTPPSEAMMLAEEARQARTEELLRQLREEAATSSSADPERASTPTQRPSAINAAPAPTLRPPAKVRAPKLQQLVSKTSVFENELYEVPEGTEADVTYAMPGSVIRVADGGRLKLFLASHNVTIKLGGPNSQVSIKRFAKNSPAPTIIGSEGEVLDGNDYLAA